MYLLIFLNQIFILFSFYFLNIFLLNLFGVIVVKPTLAVMFRHVTTSRDTM